MIYGCPLGHSVTNATQIMTVIQTNKPLNYVLLSEQSNKILPNDKVNIHNNIILK